MATEFYGVFNAQKHDLEAGIERIKNDEDKLRCLEKLDELSKDCKSALYYLPQHDQEAYSKELHRLGSLIEKVELNNSGDKKFSFKSRTTKKQAQKPVITEESEEGNAGYSKDIKGLQGGTFVDESVAGSVRIQEVINSNVVLMQQIPVVKIDNIKDSIVMLGDVQGPVYLTNAEDSTIVVNCHQFRMHQSTGCKVYISCRSGRPIIENCSNIGFGQFPPAVTPAQTFEFGGNVDDFNWIRKTHSANWHQLDVAPSFDWLLKVDKKN